jgi:ADP-L-glycero-D-manno-heptose 6-epimerase
MNNAEQEPIRQKQLLHNASILLTGAAGFIGSCLLQYLNECGFTNIINVDAFNREDKINNYRHKKYTHCIERDYLFEWLSNEKPHIDVVFHLGARTDTTEFNYSIHEELNVNYSKKIWKWCTLHQIPLVYASSAATYGNGKLGYDDNHTLPFTLEPLNPYGKSKNEFDKWALQQTDTPPNWIGLKFFNVYGPNEYHKGRMASVIFHSFKQIQQEGVVKLFKSHKQAYNDGEQLRDFVYVKDLVKVCLWFMTHNAPNGLYNLGTGTACSFKALATATFTGLDLQSNIKYIDMPMDLRETYQYFTEANMQKLLNAGYTEPFYSLAEGVDDYVRNYLRNAFQVY